MPDYHTVVGAYLFSETQGEIDGDFDVHAVPVTLQQNTEFLCSAQSKHWNQYLKFVFMYMYTVSTLIKTDQSHLMHITLVFPV